MDAALRVSLESACCTQSLLEKAGSLILRGLCIHQTLSSDTELHEINGS